MIKMEGGFNPGKGSLSKTHNTYIGDGGPVGNFLGLSFLFLLLILGIWIIFFKKKKEH